MLSDSDRGVRGSTWLMGGRVVAMGLGLTTQVVLVRALTRADFGLWALGLAAALGLRILVSLGHTRVVSRFFAIYREREDAARLRGALVVESVLITCLGAVALVAAAGVLVLSGPPFSEKYLPVVILLALAPLEALEELLESLFAAFGKIGTIIVRQHVLVPGLRLVAVLLLVAAGASLVQIAIGYLAVTVLSLSYYASMARRLLSREKMFRSGDRRRTYPVRDVFSFSVPMLSGELVYLVNGTVNILLLGALRGPVQVGALRAVMPFADANLMVRRQFYRLFLPLASALHERRDVAALGDAYWRAAAWVAVLTFPLFALTGPFASALTETLLGQEYAGSAGYLAALATAFYANAAIGFNAELLHAAARLRFVTAVNLVTAVVALAVAAVLVPQVGAWGVAAAAVSSVVVQNLLNQLGVRGELGSFLPPSPYRRAYVVVGCAALLLVAVEAVLDPGLLLAVVLSAVASLVVLSLSATALRPAEAFPELLVVGSRMSRRARR